LKKFVSIVSTPLPRTALRAVTVIFALLALHAGPTRAQAPAACTINSGANVCLPSQATYIQNKRSPYETHPTGDQACVAAAGNLYGNAYRNAKYIAAHPQWGNGCEYDIYTFGDNGVFQGRFFYQNWVLSQQICPALPEPGATYIDTSDTTVSASGRLWCSYRIPDDERSCSTAHPVQPGSGRKRFTETDYAGAGVHPLTLTRHYSSRWTDSAAATGLAPIAAWDGGWRHAYQASLTPRSDGSLRAYRPDGSMLGLTASTATANTWTASGSRDTVTALVDALGTRTGYTLTAAADDSVETYDATGKLLTIKARNGWLTTLTYSDATTPTTIAPRPGLLVAVRNQFGRELKFTYDAQGRIAEVLPPGALSGQPAGSATSPIRYVYNEAASLASGVPAQSQLTSIVWQDGSVRRYHHEDGRWPQSVTGITDEAGVRYGTYAYDSEGRVTRSELAGGAERLDFAYATDASGKPTTTVTDYSGAGGATTNRTYTFTDIGNVRYPSNLTAPCSLCGSTQQASTYDAAGDPTRQIAHDGSVTFLAYDSKGRETERAVFPASYNTATTRPALNLATKVVSTKWHATFNLPTQVAEPNKTTANAYSSKGLLTGQSWTATTDATGAAKFSAVKTGSTFATGWSYSASNLATTVIEKTDTTETGRWTVTYKTDGSINKITDAISAQSATLTANASGLPTKIAASNGAVATFTGNTRGQMIKAVTPRVTTDFSIDAPGLTNEIRFSDGRWIRYTYNASRRIIKITDSSGQVEQYAGLEPSWFLDEKTIRTAAVWLSLRGKRFADMLIPEAKAQSAVIVVPAVIVLGLILIFEGQRRNGASAPGGTSCCGQDGTPGLSGGDETLASRWSRQITTLLSDQTMPAQSTPAPIYDKAGLLVSPKACIPPPGNCDPNKHRDMQDEVNNACKGQARRCGGGLSRVELIERLELNRSCAIARDKINKTCFAGGDKDHRDQAHDAWSSVTRCEDFLSRVP
jgi:YD repeat-containing protein